MSSLALADTGTAAHSFDAAGDLKTRLDIGRRTTAQFPGGSTHYG